MDNSFRQFLLENKLTTFEGLSRLDVTDIATDLASVRSDISRLAIDVQNVQAVTNTLTSDFTQVRGEVASLSTDVSNLDDHVESLDDVVMNLNEDVSTFSERLDTIESQVDVIPTLASNVSTLQSSVTTLTSRVSAVESSVTTLTTRTTAVENRVTDLDTRLGTLTSNVSIGPYLCNDRIGFIHNMATSNPYTRSIRIQPNSGDAKHRVRYGEWFSCWLDGSDTPRCKFTGPNDNINNPINANVGFGRSYFHYGTTTSQTIADVVILSVGHP